MDVFISLIISIFEEGFIYGIMAIGVYITYKVLDFPDLTVDGSFPLGMCLTGLLISVGVDPWIACVLSFLAGIHNQLSVRSRIFYESSWNCG